MASSASIILQLQNQTAPQLRAAADQFKALSAEEQKAEQAAIRYAAAIQRAERESVQTATAVARLAKEEQNVAAATARAEAAQARAASATANAGRSTGGLSSAVSGLKNALGGLGLAFGAQQVIQFGISSAQAALSLRETQNSLRAVAGDAKTYQEALATAREQQVLFGGSLEENIQGLTGLTITARQSGANLQQLIDISQRLGTLDPAQGVAGARIALSEALSGDPTSLAKRYEIPKAALKALRDESTSASDKLAIIDQYLNKVGITSAAVAGKVDQTALTFRRLSQAVEDVVTKGGGDIADALAPAATGLTRLLQGGKGLDEILVGLSSSLKQGGNWTAYIGQAFHLTGESVDFARGVLQNFGIAQAEVTTTTAQELDMEDRRVQQLNAARAAQEALTAKIREQIDTMNESIAKGAQDAAAKDAQQAKAALLAEQNRLVIDSFLQLNPTIDASAAASLAAAQGYDPQIAQLIALAAEARNAKNALAGLTGGVKEDRLERDRPEDRAQARTAGAELVRNQAAAAEAARREQINRTGTTAQKILLAEKERTEAIRRYGKGSAEAISAETTLIGLKQQAAAEDERNGRRRIKDANSALSLEERIRDSKEKQLKATLDASEAIIKDRQERRKEEREIRAAQRILSSGRASAEFKAAAADRLALIGINRQQRALAIQGQLATAGGQIVNGRVMQSLPGGGAAPALPAVGGVPAAIPGAPAIGPAPSAAEAGIVVQVYLDNEQIAAKQVQILMQGRRQSNAAGGGLGGG